MRKPLAILGGTFDPVHFGHLSVAWEASEILDAEVHLVPARIPPHRPPPHAGAAERAAMLRVALAGQDHLCLDTRELNREGPSYTVDTLHELRAGQGERPLVLLLGADAFAGLSEWDRWRELFELAHIGVLRRPGNGHDLPVVLAQAVRDRYTEDARDLHATAAGRVIDIDVTPLDISATRIRERLAAGREPRYLVPSGLLEDPALLAPYR